MILDLLREIYLYEYVNLWNWNIIINIWNVNKSQIIAALKDSIQQSNREHTFTVESVGKCHKNNLNLDQPLAVTIRLTISLVLHGTQLKSVNNNNNQKSIIN